MNLIPWLIKSFVWYFPVSWPPLQVLYVRVFFVLWNCFNFHNTVCTTKPDLKCHVSLSGINRNPSTIFSGLLYKMIKRMKPRSCTLGGGQKISESTSHSLSLHWSPFLWSSWLYASHLEQKKKKSGAVVSDYLWPFSTSLLLNLWELGKQSFLFPSVDIQAESCFLYSWTMAMPT